LHSVAEGGRVRTLTKQPGALLASSVQFVGQDALLITNAGFFRSTDAGRTWVRWPLAPPVVRTATVVYEGGEDLLDLSATPFLQSHDGGKSWQDVALPTGLAVGDQVLPEAYAVAAPGDVWLVLEDQHGRQDLVRSRDAGRTWALASSSVPASYATALAARGEEGFVVGPRPNELSRTEDAGRRWQRVAVFPLRWRITSVSLGGPGDVWLTMWDSNHLRTMLMHSSDGGVHWQMSVAQNAALTDVTFADAQHGWLLTAPGPKPGNLFRSIDGGRRFSEVWPVLLPAPQMSGSS
jgi:photosystem II stability/assembly factor-like uncharacterized protein